MKFDKSKLKMRKLEPPARHTFSKGEIVSGVMLEIKKMPLKDGGIVSRYTMELEDGRRVFFLGTSQLDQMMSPRDQGHYFEIVYVGDDTNVVRNGRAMQVFDVARSEHPVMPIGAVGQQLGDGTYITDEDIPF
jgi:hypothetical protein